MKRILICFFAILLLVPALSSADEDILVTGSDQMYDNIEILGRSCLVSVEDKEIWVYYELRNAGKNPIHIFDSKTKIQFTDSKGNVCCELGDCRFTPNHVRPGQVFFLRNTVWGNSEYSFGKPVDYQNILQADDYKLNLELWSWVDYIDEKYDIPIPCSVDSYDIDGNNLSYKVSLFNDTGEDLVKTQFIVSCVIRDKKGNPVYCETNYIDNENIAAGETKQFSFSPYTVAIDFLLRHGFNIPGISCYAYYKKPYMPK